MRAREALEHVVIAARARAWLNGCDVVGSGACLHGRPFVRNLGTIEIASGLVMSSLPVRSHLVTGPKGILRVGKNVRIAHGASISAYHELVIGDDVVIGPFAMLLDSDYHGSTGHGSLGPPRPIHIGRGVRIGAGVVVLRGAVIGDGAVIDAHSVVNRYVPSDVRVAGVPARVVVLA